MNPILFSVYNCMFICMVFSNCCQCIYIRFCTEIDDFKIRLYTSQIKYLSLVRDLTFVVYCILVAFTEDNQQLLFGKFAQTCTMMGHTLVNALTCTPQALLANQMKYYRCPTMLGKYVFSSRTANRFCIFYIEIPPRFY